MPVSNHTYSKTSRFFLWLVLLGYLAVLTKLVVFKKPPGYIRRHLAGLYHHYNWKMVKANMDNGNFNIKPFATIKMYLAANMPAEYAISNLVGNVAGFIPLGILLPILFPRLGAAATIFTVFLFSLCFEIFQLFAMLGVCDIDDLLLNTLGGGIGYFFFWLAKKWMHSLQPKGFELKT